eukprot:scaffold34930_cov191-Amphora_coffeaeformis.AAC.3
MLKTKSWPTWASHGSRSDYGTYQSKKSPKDVDLPKPAATVSFIRGRIFKKKERATFVRVGSTKLDLTPLDRYNP